MNSTALDTLTAARRLGFSLAKTAALLELKRNPNLTPAGLARVQRLDLSTAIMTIRRLENEGLVVRERGRHQPARLTHEGRSALMLLDLETERAEQTRELLNN